MEQFLKARRPDIGARDLDPNATFQAFQQGMSPIDFVNQPNIVPQQSSSVSSKAIWISATVGLVLILVVGLILTLGRTAGIAHGEQEAKVVTVVDLKRNNVSYNGVRVRIVGYYVDDGTNDKAGKFVLSDLTPSDFLTNVDMKMLTTDGDSIMKQQSVFASPA